MKTHSYSFFILLLVVFSFLISYSAGQESELKRKWKKEQKWRQLEPPEEMEDLKEWIQEGNRNKKRAASFKLATMKPDLKKRDKVLDTIETALASENKFVQRMGANATYKWAYIVWVKQKNKEKSNPPLEKRKDIYSYLIRIIKKHSDIEARTSAIKALGLGYPADNKQIPLFVKMYREAESVQEKGTFIQLFHLWKLKEKRVIKIYKEALTSKNNFLQKQTAKAVGTLTPKEVLGTLLTSYINSEPRMKPSFEQAIRKYKNSSSEAIEELKKLKGKMKHDQLKQLLNDVLRKSKK